MTRWAMVIDVEKCVGCETCIQVCTDANNVPQGAAWRRSAGQWLQIHATGRRVFFTLGCMHCENPSCLKVCPTTATHRRPDGIVDIDYNRCVGCAACITACPYDARRITTIDTVPSRASRQIGKNEKDLDRIGICTKCNFCAHRLDAGIENGLRPGVDEAATPNCVRYCIADVLHFGDLDDPESNVVQLLNTRQSVKLLDELDNGPAVYYLV